MYSDTSLKGKSTTTVTSESPALESLTEPFYELYYQIINAVIY